MTQQYYEWIHDDVECIDSGWSYGNYYARRCKVCGEEWTDRSNECSSILGD